MPIHRYYLADFVSIQRQSFFELLETGLIEEFAKRNPITSVKQDFELFFYPEYYRLTRPEYSPHEAIVKNKSYTSKLFIPVQLTDKKRGKMLLNWVYIGNIPLMTKRGHFILNGAARVIVNQILRSPGIYYQEKIYENYEEKWSQKPEDSFKRYYADLICMRGTWLRIEMDKEKKIWAQMKKGPKIPIFWFLLAMGLSEKKILKSIKDSLILLNNLKFNSDSSEFSGALNAPQSRASLNAGPNQTQSQFPIFDWEKGKKLGKKGNASELKSGIMVNATPNPLRGLGVGEFLENENGDENENGKRKAKEYFYLKNPPEAWREIYNLINSSLAPRRGTVSNPLAKQEGKRGGSAGSQPRTSLNSPKGNGTGVKTKEETKYRSAAEEGRKWLYNRFLNQRFYDLGKQGRSSFNRKLGLNISPTQLTLTGLDVLYATDYLIKVEKGLFKIDDIDHLKNRRVRTSGELIQIQIGVGLVRLEKSIREALNRASLEYSNIEAFNSQLKPYTRSSSSPISIKQTSNTISSASQLPAAFLNISPSQSPVGGLNGPPSTNPPAGSKKAWQKENSILSDESFTISNFINHKPFNSAIREFFGTSPLSQFMDQINPLAELTHKRRLSSMGPGGVTRDSATLAIRGIHPTHYGRICPIETPEGKNTGLVNSMTTYARVNRNGILESPFYKVYKGQVQRNTGMYFFSAEQEEKIKLAAADLSVSSIGFLPKSLIPVRIAEDFTKIARSHVQYIGVSPLQMISIAASLIPFLEHDDANRALMGSNMQRQAVPLIRPERPIVGTGLEARAVSDSGHNLIAKYSGFVKYVSAKKIVIYSLVYK
jgi:DNA-directed RNA polymerase beta subunit